MDGHTSRVVASSEQNTTGSPSFTNNMTGSRGTQDTVLTDQQLLDTISSTNLSNQLHNLGIVVSSISSNDQETPLSALWNGKEDAGNERLAIVRLLKNFDFFPKT